MLSNFAFFFFHYFHESIFQFACVFLCFLCQCPLSILDDRSKLLKTRNVFVLAPICLQHLVWWVSVKILILQLCRFNSQINNYQLVFFRTYLLLFQEMIQHVQNQGKKFNSFKKINKLHEIADIFECLLYTRHCCLHFV